MGVHGVTPCFRFSSIGMMAPASFVSCEVVDEELIVWVPFH